MIIADKNYNSTLIKIENLKNILNEVEQNINNQIPQSITNEFNKTKIEILNWIDEIQFNLIEFINIENE